MKSELQYPTIEHIGKNTGLKNENVAKAFLETLIWLDQDAPERFDGLTGKFKFDIQDFIEHNDQYNHDTKRWENCGTSCCIAGAASMYLNFHGSAKEQYLTLSDFEHMDDQLPKLFYPQGQKKPKTAARVLRHFLFTGKVDWKVRVDTIYEVEHE